MKLLPLSIMYAGILYIAPFFGGVLNVELGGVVHAQEASNGTPITSVKVPAMRNRVYAQLARAQQLADEGVKIAGFDVLDEVKEQIDSLNSYEKAMLWNFYAFMYYGNDDVEMALENFQNVIKEQAIPVSLRLSTLYSLSQLSMQLENYEQALMYLTQWKKLNPKALTANQHMLFAQVYYQSKAYLDSLVYVENAIRIVTKLNEIPKENWLILARANYYELAQPEKVTEVMEQLVRYYSKPDYWMQLSAMYGEIGQEVKQLAVMESAWQAGYISKSQDIITLVQLYRFHGVPIKAANVLENAIAEGKVVAEEKYWQMLAQAYIAAKEDEKAIPVLINAAEIADSGKFDEQLAQAYLNLEKWQLAIDSANKALMRGKLENSGNMHLALGMSYFNLQKFDDALMAFSTAKKIKDSAKMATQWYHYVEKEKGHQTQLAMIN